MLNNIEKSRPRKITTITFCSLLAAVLVSSCSDQLLQPNRSHPSMDITNNPTTYCIGRVLIDIPASMQLSSPEVAATISNTATLERLSISTKTGISVKEYELTIANRWNEVQSYTKKPTGRPYSEPSKKNKVRENGVIFTFHHESVESNVRRVEGKLLSDFITLYDAEGYYWENGTMFIVKNRGAYNGLSDDILTSIKSMRYRETTEVPSGTGICLNGGYIEHYYRGTPERFIWSAKLPKGLELSIFSTTGVEPKSQLQQYGGLVTRNPDDPDMIIGGKELRAARRPNDHLPAEELVTVATTGYDEVGEPADFEINVDATWEFIGENPPNAKPYVRVEMGLTPIAIAYRPTDLTAYPSSNSAIPTKEEFLALWDSIAKTIRFYPNALTRKPVEPPKPPAPSPTAQQRASNKQALDDFLGEG